MLDTPRTDEQAAGQAAKRIVWVSDAHLDHLEPNGVEEFFQSLADAAPDVLLLGGDIALADSLELHLRRLEGLAQCPIYFVLGNHDYYHGSIANLRQSMAALNHNTCHLRWLREAGVVGLTTRAGLVGCGGWGDGRLGDYASSPVRLNDSVYIHDLAALERHAQLLKMRELGRDAANHLCQVLPEAVARYEHILVLLHVPPFPEACRHDGCLVDKDWLPYFACGAVGDVLLQTARANTYHQFTVLCGHTHTAANTHLLPNLQVKVASAEYGSPRIEEVLLIP